MKALELLSPLSMRRHPTWHVIPNKGMSRSLLLFLALCISAARSSSPVPKKLANSAMLDELDELSGPQRLMVEIPADAKGMYPSDPSKVHDANVFLRALASSSSFRNEYWHRRPLHISRRSCPKELRSRLAFVPGSFTIDEDLAQIDGTFVTGHKTAEALRNGTDESTWAFVPLKSEPSAATAYADVAAALDGGTIYFNNAGALWNVCGCFCLLTNAALGMPASVNIYITPPKCRLSVPPHTDRQDVLVFQTQGSKRWRVFKPPTRRRGTADPLNRGKGGDVLSFEEMDDEPLLDVVLREGDVLYVPTGFPHTTDTATGIGSSSDGQTSVHLTMGLDTHAFGLTYAHLRWATLQKAGKPFAVKIKDDDVYWQSSECLPIGFLAPGQFWEEYLRTGSACPKYVELIGDELRRIMVLLEPDRWLPPEGAGRDADGAGGGATEVSEREELPSDELIGCVVRYFLETHLNALFAIQGGMYRNANPRDDDTLIRAYEGSQLQNKLMEDLGAFAGDCAMRESFEGIRRRLDARVEEYLK